ncbi:uncharacterized protein LOC115686199 [Syzygium oleosum]|uniref:uncharacterized protein LOC115686199 n=1 Tax=Syzygium oleosum TaxID=219896 RepID=UPI0011D2C554|nr:uncharacterized protein LOC115686199 [Syzygium oleosum]
MLFIHKLISSSPRLLFCRLHNGCSNATAASSGRDEGGRHRAARSPCAWLRLMAQEIRDKWQSLVARIGSRRRRQGQVAAVAAASEFGYDPTSYALNFEDDRSREWDGESPARNFSARLPESPDQSPPGKMPGEEIVAARR